MSRWDFPVPESPKLWARTIDSLARALRRIAKATGRPMRLRYAKVAEFQARGVVHFHAIIRLDGYNPADPLAILPPPGCLDVIDLAELIRHAASSTAIATPAHPDRPDGWPLAWGAQTDIRVIRTGIADAELTEQHVAGYLAKYATKSTEAVASIDSRGEGSHVACLINTCWQLGRPGTGEHYSRLRPKADMLGFSGHFSTKSRRYSTTLGALRAARRPSPRAGVRVIPASDFDTAEHTDDDDTVLVINREWTYTGSGWLTLADAALANASADAARERRPARAAVA
ncbi:MAG: replication initiator [Pseudonocardiales bacterium]